MYELVCLSRDNLIGETICLEGDSATIQGFVYLVRTMTAFVLVLY
jgi:vacuolar-type H+-ATPase catalytic subunit A/Vma1